MPMKRRSMVGPSFPFAPSLPTGVVVGWAGVATNLTHHWPMDDANVSGTTVTDIVGSVHGTSTGSGVTSAAGPGGGVGKARQFNGSDTISLSGNVFADMSAVDTTVCAWIFCSDVTSMGPDGNAPMWLNVADGTNGWALANVPGTSPVTIAGGNVTNNEMGGQSNPVLTNNTWFHVAATKRGGFIVFDTLFYVNGILNQASSLAAESGAQNSNWFGGRSITNHRVMNGCRLGRVVTYNRVLTAAEILQNYNAN